MATDCPTPDTPMVDAGSAVKEAIWRATSEVWLESQRSHFGRGAEGYVAAIRTLIALEAPAKALLANLQDQGGDQEIVLNNEARGLASRVLSSIPEAMAS